MSVAEVTVLTTDQARNEDEKLAKPVNVVAGIGTASSLADSLITVLAKSDWEERARLSPRLALPIMGRSNSKGAVLQVLRDLREGIDTEETRFIRDDALCRLDNHIVLSSLFLTTRPVDKLHFDCHDYTYCTETLKRNKTIWTDRTAIENVDGVTVLDAMRAITDWRDPSDLRKGELVHYAGIEWDPWEFREFNDRESIDVEVGRIALSTDRLAH